MYSRYFLVQRCVQLTVQYSLLSMFVDRYVVTVHIIYLVHIYFSFYMNLSLSLSRGSLGSTMEVDR
jgi:hypothetical protein